MNRDRQALSQIKALHRENLQRNLQQRMEAARVRGDEHLLRLLEVEANYLK